MAISTNISDLTQVGRTTAPDPSQPQVSVSKSLDFTAAGDFTLDFTSVNQTQQFGIPRTLYFDNGTNPNQVIVTVSITGQQLTLAPYSIGYYNLTASEASTIQFVSAGGASAVSPLSVFNHVVQPSVWYSYGTSNPLSSTAVEGSIVDGTSIAAATNPNPFLIAAKDYATGLLHNLSASAVGVLNVAVAALAQLPATLGAKTGALSLSVVPNTDTPFKTTSQGYSFSHIAAAATTNVKAGAGVLHAVIVNAKGTVASTLTIYDNIVGAGTVIAIIDSLNLSGTFEFDIAFATGLTIVSTGTVAPDFTVSYR